MPHPTTDYHVESSEEWLARLHRRLNPRYDYSIAPADSVECTSCYATIGDKKKAILLDGRYYACCTECADQYDEFKHPKMGRCLSCGAEHREQYEWDQKLDRDRQYAAITRKG